MKIKTAVSRLGTVKRRELFSRAGLPNDPFATVYSAYSPKASSTVTLVGDLAYLNYLRCEGDPSIKHMSYRPNAVLIDPLEKTGTVPIKAESTDNRGVLTLIELRRSKKQNEAQTPSRNARVEFYKQRLLEDISAKRIAVRAIKHVVITEVNLILGNKISLCNWHMMLPYLAQAKYYSLSSHREQIRDLLNLSGEMTLKAILNCGHDDSDKALLAAAVIDGIANGRWDSDVKENVFGVHTVVRSF